MTQSPRGAHDEQHLRTFARVLHKITEEYNFSRSRSIGEALKVMRDKFDVNAARILHDHNYTIPSPGEEIHRLKIDFSDKSEEWFKLWDPVVPDAPDVGPEADIQEGDELIHTQDGNEARAKVVAVGAGMALTENEQGQLKETELATLRNTLETTNMRLERDGEILVEWDHGDPWGSGNDTKCGGSE